MSDLFTLIFEQHLNFELHICKLIRSFVLHLRNIAKIKAFAVI